MRRAALLLAALLPAALAPASGLALAGESPAARVRILFPRGGQTLDRVVTIRGEAVGVTAPRLTLVLNGVALSVPRDGDAFATTQVLAPGENSIRVRAEAGGLTVEDDVCVYALVPQKDLRVTLTWDTPATDVDLWVTGPDGEKVFYQQKQGAAGGTLDTDVTTGFGPETFTHARALEGTYRIQAHYFGGAPPTRVTVVVVRGEGTPDEERATFLGVLARPNDVLEVGAFVVRAR